MSIMLDVMKIYDVTVPVSERTPVYEGDPAVVIGSEYLLENGDDANVSKVSMGVHTGTHIDAPSHFITGGKKVTEIDLEVLIGPARVIEVPSDVNAIGPGHLPELDGSSRVLIKTRNSRFWADPESGFRRDYTYITPGAARDLVERGIEIVGFDYLSVEEFGFESPETHRLFLGNDVVILEGLDLSTVSPGEYEMICLPLKLDGGTGDGAPARTVLLG